MDLIKGSSPAIQHIKDMIRQVVDTDLNVLICGESGTGKEVVARTLHALSSRRRKPFIKVNCAALPGELLESELFGHERGAFTGALTTKPGKFEMADTGTIFLDEIGDMPYNLQAKLLQVLQDGVFSRVGGVREISVNTWVIAATNHDLDSDVQKGTFREDLLYRIKLITIQIPPLRERKEDIPVLLAHFLNKHRGSLKQKDITIPNTLMEAFTAYDWPGNVRELENYTRRLLVFGDPAAIEREIRERTTKNAAPQFDIGSILTDTSDIQSFLSQHLMPGETETFPPLKEIQRRCLAHIEKIVIEEVLRRTGGNRKETARILQISYKALSYKIRDFGVNTSLLSSKGVSVTLEEDRSN